MTYGEFGRYHAQWYINAAYFYKYNKSWCKANPEDFWKKFFKGSDDDVDYYKPDYDTYWEEQEDEEAEEYAMKWTKEDKKIRGQYTKEKGPFGNASPAFIVHVWNNIKHDKDLIEGAKFFLDSEAY